MEPLTLETSQGQVSFDEPGKARASARRWRRMARELDTPDAPPEATLRAHELRANAKAAEDWARRHEDQKPAPAAHPPAAGRSERAAAGTVESSSSAKDGARRRAARTLTEVGARKARSKATGTARKARKASRRYEAEGGAPVVTGGGSLAIFFFGSVIMLVLFEDLLSGKGSRNFARATSTLTSLADRLIRPVPLVSSNNP